MPDTLRAGRYVIVGVLGEGSQGRTFDAVDKRVGQPVAIKRFDVRGARGWKDVELAERETRVLQTLSHPGLPRYVDHFEEDGALYLVTEKMPGASLAAVKRQGGPFGEADALRLLEDAAGILAYLHGRSPPVVHRDLKPANVIRRPDGTYAFVDFGSVRDHLRPEGGSTVVGTFGYMAPEQFQGRALPGSDVYGVGATVLAMLTGTEPEGLPHKGLAIDVRGALAGLPGRPSERLTRILERMLDPDPDQRASAIGPLLTEEPRRRSRPDVSDVPHAPREGDAWQGGLPWEPGRAPWDEPWRREVRQQIRRARREARDHARRARSEARQHAQAWRGAHRGHGPPWPLEVIFTLVFSVGLVVVSVITQVALPILLRVLSIFFARKALLDAADAVQQAGGEAVRSIAQSRRWMRGDPPPARGTGEPLPAPRTRVAPGVGSHEPQGTGIRVTRVEPGEALDEDDAQDEPGARHKL